MEVSVTDSGETTFSFEAGPVSRIQINPNLGYMRILTPFKEVKEALNKMDLRCRISPQDGQIAIQIYDKNPQEKYAQVLDDLKLNGFLKEGDAEEIKGMLGGALKKSPPSPSQGPSQGRSGLKERISRLINRHNGPERDEGETLQR